VHLEGTLLSRISARQRAGHVQKGLKLFIRVEWVSGKRIIKVERVLGIALIIRVIHNHGSRRMKGTHADISTTVLKKSKNLFWYINHGSQFFCKNT
jgi:hypothetical protein